MITLPSILRTALVSYPGLSGFVIGFIGVYFALSISPIIVKNLTIVFMLILLLLIAVTASAWSEKIPIVIIVISLYIPLFVVVAIIIQGVAVYKLAETIVEQSAIIAAIATFFVMSLKVAVEAWRAWRESTNKEQDIELRREIFEFEKLKDKSN
jgi:hypothetical protein